MKTLVFALIVEIWSTTGGFVESTTQYGLWADVRTCIWFSEILSLQGSGKYRHPVVSYCVPRYVDASEVEIY